MNILHQDTQMSQMYVAAKAYFDANAGIKALEKVKADNRPLLEKQTGETVLDDLKVNFSSHTEQVLDMLQVEAFLNAKGAKLDDFRVEKCKTRLVVSKVR